MNNLKYIGCTLFLSYLLTSCNDKVIMQNSEQNQVRENSYPSSQDAVKKGKLDLLELSKNKNYNLKIDAAALERSNPQTSVKSFDVNFERLLSADSTSIASISTESQKLNTPFINGNQVVAVISTSKVEKGWELNELTNAVLAEDLTKIRSDINNTDFPISIFEVPNINTTIYEAIVQGRKLYFTRTNGLALQRAESESAIFQQIKVEAQLFQRKYGNIKDKHRLVR